MIFRCSNNTLTCLCFDVGHSIHSIRQFMYERIDKLWFSHRLGLAFNTAQLENDAKASFGDKLINSVTFPRFSMYNDY